MMYPRFLTVIVSLPLLLLLLSSTLSSYYCYGFVSSSSSSSSSFDNRKFSNNNKKSLSSRLAFMMQQQQPRAIIITTTTTTTSATTTTTRRTTSSSSMLASSSTSINNDNNDSKYYFAYGSNMLPSTMISLRNIKKPISVSAAILPNYEIHFPFPSAACVKSTMISNYSSNIMADVVVHGVLYQLNNQDFKIVEQTEGVTEGSFYRWEECIVYPYNGNNDNAGINTLYSNSNTNTNTNSNMISCYTLVRNDKIYDNNQNMIKSFMNNNNNPILPNQSYLRILQQGASYWKLDRSYQIYLMKFTSSSNNNNNNMGDFSGLLLQIMELINPPYESIQKYY